MTLLLIWCIMGCVVAICAEVGCRRIDGTRLKLLTLLLVVIIWPVVLYLVWRDS